MILRESSSVVGSASQPYAAGQVDGAQPQQPAAVQGGHRRLRVPIRWKLVLSIGIPILIVYVAALWYDYVRLREAAFAHRQTYMAELASRYATALDAEFAKAAQVAQSTATFLDIAPSLTEEDIYEILRANVRDNPSVYGAAIAFEPHGFESGRRLLSPYVYRGADDALVAIDIGKESYDYTDGRWEWYTRPRVENRPIWTEPYFDEGAGNVLMCTHSVPFYRDDRLRGIATIDVRVDQLQDRLQEGLLRSGGWAIISRNGTFISFPAPNVIMRETIFSLADRRGRPDLRMLGQRMLSGERGVGRYSGLQIEEPTWYFYAPIASTGWAFTASVPEAEIMAPVYDQLETGLGIMLAGLAVIVGILLFASFRITSPLEKLSMAVEQLAVGNLDVQVQGIRHRDEIGDLARGFNRMTRELKTHVKALTEEHAARETVEREMHVAREIQTSLLPLTFPPYPQRKEFDLHAVNVPAKHVAGDFYDFFFTDPETLTFVIADVSGKGVPAALFMAVTRTVVRNLAQHGESPGQILNHANDILRDGNVHAMFVTSFVAHYNTVTGKVTYANAGHHKPLLISRDGRIQRFGEVTGTLLGVLDGETFGECEAKLDIGDRLILYTDGVTEARSPEGDFFGEERLTELLAKYGRKSLSEICDAVITEIEAFEHGERKDDVTILALARNS